MRKESRSSEEAMATRVIFLEETVVRGNSSVEYVAAYVSASLRDEKVATIR